MGGGDDSFTFLGRQKHNGNTACDFLLANWHTYASTYVRMYHGFSTAMGGCRWGRADARME